METAIELEKLGKNDPKFHVNTHKSTPSLSVSPKCTRLTRPLLRQGASPRRHAGTCQVHNSRCGQHIPLGKLSLCPLTSLGKRQSVGIGQNLSTR